MGYECCSVGGKRQDYCGSHSTPQSDRLRNLERETLSQLSQGMMVSGSLPGQILKMLISVSGFNNILEIGSYTGYSAVAMAEALLENSPEGKLVCIDNFSDEAEAERLFDKYIGEMNEQRKGLIEPLKTSGREGLALLKSRGQVFDFCFVDADKVSQIEYFESLFDGLLRVGGLMVVDNTLWSSRVIDIRSNMDETTASIAEFNEHVVKDGRAHVVQLPVRDGITVIRRIS